MVQRVENLVFEGGGVLGIAYLGVLHYLYEHGFMANVARVAGASAGAITACLTSFNLPFEQLKATVDTLDYRKIPMKDASPDMPVISSLVRKELDAAFEDWECVLRLVKNYGWYSSEYFYQWIRDQIARQFDPRKKAPPYTFADFRDPQLHLGGRPFFDLSIIGTDISWRDSRVFSFETTPGMEVAAAVRISMSIPVFFEAVKQEQDGRVDVYSDGGVMRNYPLNIFDGATFANPFTLGARFKVADAWHPVNSLLDYISNLFQAFMRIQEVEYETDPQAITRSIVIDPGQVSFVDFNITPGDATYSFLYTAGYDAAAGYFKRVNITPYDGFMGFPKG